MEPTNPYNRSVSYSPPTITSMPSTSPPPPSATGSAIQSTKKFLFKNSDVIFENDIIQVGIKAEAVKSILNVELYYGNKTGFNLTNISSSITLPETLEPGKNKLSFENNIF